MADDASDLLEAVPLERDAHRAKSHRRPRRATDSVAGAAFAGLVVGIVLSVVLALSDAGTSETTSSPRIRDGFVIKVEPEAAAAADDVRVDLARLAEDSLARVAELLPGLDLVVDIDVNRSRGAINEIRIPGNTDPTSGEVFVRLPSEKVDAETLRVWLPEVLAHEAHHSLRIRRGPGYGSTLGGFMVTERTVFFVDEEPSIGGGQIARVELATKGTAAVVSNAGGAPFAGPTFSVQPCRA